MLTQRLSPLSYTTVTLRIIITLELMIFFAGCGSVANPHLYPIPDITDTGEGLPVDTGELGAAYADVAGLPDCHVPYIVLPPEESVKHGDIGIWEVVVVNEIVYGDRNTSRPFPVVYGVIYYDEVGVGEKVVDGVVDVAWLVVRYVNTPEGGLPENAHAYSLACPAPE